MAGASTGASVVGAGSEDAAALVVPSGVVVVVVDEPHAATDNDAATNATARFARGRAVLEATRPAGWVAAQNGQLASWMRT